MGENQSNWENNFFGLLSGGVIDSWLKARGGGTPVNLGWVCATKGLKTRLYLKI